MKTSLKMKATYLLLAMLVSVSLNFQLHGTTLYVDVNSQNPTPPYATWATAANMIQDAVDAANTGDQVLVTNGIYTTGLTLVAGVANSNRVAVLKPLTLVSVNGPEFTTIVGYRNANNLAVEIRCVYLTNGATLSGFTLTNGFARSGPYDAGGGGVASASTNTLVTNCVVIGCGLGLSGGTTVNSTIIGNVLGGAKAAVLSNCVIRLNQLANYGAGAYDCTLYDCKVLNNISTLYGGGGAAYSTLFRCVVANNQGSGTGGAYASTLVNCLLTGNSSASTGAASSCLLSNCTVSGNITTATGAGTGGVASSTCVNTVIYGNITTGSFPNFAGGSLNYCCTAPLPASGTGNIDIPPKFVDEVNGDFRLKSNSPCINTGLNSYVASVTDLGGNPRIVGGTVDIGAYEFQNFQPTLRIASSESTVVLSWPAWAADFQLQETAALASMGTSWSNTVGVPIPTTNDYSVTLPVDATTKAFRLIK